MSNPRHLSLDSARTDDFSELSQLRALTLHALAIVNPLRLPVSMSFGGTFPYRIVCLPNLFEGGRDRHRTFATAV
jgi:hypothetical protein